MTGARRWTPKWGAAISGSCANGAGMTFWSRFRLPLIAAALVIAVVGLYAISPFLSLWRLQRAADRNDLAALEQLIDFPAVRASLKEQATGGMRDKLGGVLPSRLVAGWITQAISPEVVNRTIDERVTPAGIAQMIKGAQIEHASFSDWTVFTFQTRTLKASARFSGFGWRVFWVQLPGL